MHEPPSSTGSGAAPTEPIGPGAGGARAGSGGGGGASHQPPASIPLPGPESATVGAMIGPYRLLDLLGQGGFGSVFLAERREPFVQRVAIKVIKPGMDSAAVIARFEQERQALAVMDHPNVAKVLDGGTTPPDMGSRPYFVMELVQGEPLTTYCDRHNLTIRQRLELFIPVCEAVQHAHMKGIIHRDIKPSNILVSVKDGAAIPKVIDFGVAKAVSHTLTEKTIFTERGQIIGTPEYMSPEQAEMGATDIDTRTDVYSLGVVLYELLTGLLPFDARELRSKGYGEIQRIIREVDPPKPSTRLSTAEEDHHRGTESTEKSTEANASTKREREHALPRGKQHPLPEGGGGGWAKPEAGSPTHDSTARIVRARGTSLESLTRELRRELDWIPLKALRKDRTRRYATPMDLAEDVRHYLTGQPLVAAPESRAYLFKKFVRRNRGPVLAAAAVFGVLVAGIAGTLWQAGEARREATNARAAEAEQRRLAEAEGAARKTADAKTAEAEVARAAEAGARERADANAAQAKAASASAAYEAYVSAITAADTKLSVQDRYHANALLSGTPASLRGWEYKYLRSSFRTWSRRLDATANGVCLAISPDDQYLLVGDGAGAAHLYSTATGEACGQWQAHNATLAQVGFTRDGNAIITAGYDGHVRMWHAATLVLLSSVEVTQIDDIPCITPAAVEMEDGRIVDAAPENLSGGYSINTENVVVSPDRTRIATIANPDQCDDNVVRVLDLATTECIATLIGQEGRVHSTAFSPDGRRLVTVGDNSARVWDIESATQTAHLVGHEKWLTMAAFSPDGERVVTASSDHTARIWNAHTGAQIARLDGHQSIVRQVVFSPDGRHVAAVADDYSVRLWDSRTGAQMTQPKVLGAAFAWVMFTPDSSCLLLGSYGTRGAWAWDVEKGTLADTLSWFSGPDVAFSADGMTLWGMDASENDMLAFDLSHVCGRHKRRQNLQVIEYGDKSANGQLAVCVIEGVARVVEVGSRRVLAELGGGSSQAAAGSVTDIVASEFSAAGDLVFTATADGQLQTWDTQGWRLVAATDCGVRNVSDAGFSPDGSRVILRFDDGRMELVDGLSGRCLNLWPAITPPGEVAVFADARGPSRQWGTLGAAFIGNGARVLVLEADHRCHVIDASTGDTISLLGPDQRDYEALAYVVNPAGTLVAIALERQYHDDGGRRVPVEGSRPQCNLVDISTGNVIVPLTPSVPDESKEAASKPKTGDPRDRGWHLATGEAAGGGAFSPDSSRLLSWREDVLTVWDARTGRALLPAMAGHMAGIRGACWSADGSRIASVANDGTVRVWDGSNGREFLVLHHDARGMFGIRFSDDDSVLIAGSANGPVRRWDATTRAFRYENRGRVRLGSWTRPDRPGPTARALNNAAYKPVRTARAADLASPAALADALLKAERAALLASSAHAGMDYYVLNTLGVVQYRVGEYADAISTLAASEAGAAKFGEGAQAGNWAFIALSHHRLGHKAEAAAARAKFESLSVDPKVSEADPDVLEWLREIQDVMGP